MNRAFILLAMAGCIETGIGSNYPDFKESEYVPVQNITQTDVITQVTTPMVDVLWTIDNSCSMSNEQDELAENFPVFIDYFTGSGLDYQIGVTSTDLDRTTGNGNNGQLRTAGGVKYISLDTPTPEVVFSTMARMGTSGSGTEKGLGATYRALEVHRDTYNAGFYRDEASIHTVVITDEKDQTPGSIITQPEFVDWYDGLKREADQRSFSCIVTMSGFDRGAAYLNSAAQIGGITWDIADSDWSEVLERLGIQASGLKREYFLSQRPVNGTVSVKVRTPMGAEIAFSETQLDEYGLPIVETAATATSYYTYDSTRNSITFLTFIPEALSQVVISYTLLSALQEDVL